MKKRLYVKQLGIPVRQETYEAIVKLCDEQELGIAEWVRDAIEVKLSQGENQGDQITEG
jgi:hypothetical protein